MICRHLPKCAVKLRDITHLIVIIVIVTLLRATSYGSCHMVYADI